MTFAWRWPDRQSERRRREKILIHLCQHTVPCTNHQLRTLKRSLASPRTGIIRLYSIQTKLGITYSLPVANNDSVVFSKFADASHVISMFFLDALKSANAGPWGLCNSAYIQSYSSTSGQFVFGLYTLNHDLGCVSCPKTTTDCPKCIGSNQILTMTLS